MPDVYSVYLVYINQVPIVGRWHVIPVVCAVPTRLVVVVAVLEKFLAPTIVDGNHGLWV